MKNKTYEISDQGEIIFIWKFIIYKGKLRKKLIATIDKGSESAIYKNVTDEEMHEIKKNLNLYKN